MRRDSIRLTRRHQLAVYSILAVVFITGVVWSILHYLVGPGADFGRPPGEVWMLKIHGAGAMATLVVIGTLLPLHVRSAWRASRNRVNGIILLTALGLLTLTGYGLYYIGGETFRFATSVLHLALGVVLPILLAIHVIRGRQSRPSRMVRETLSKTGVSGR